MIALDRVLASVNGGSWSAPVQSGTFTGGDPASGSTVFICVAWVDGYTPTITDNVVGSPNTYVEEGYVNNSTSNVSISFYRASNIVTRSGFKITASASPAYFGKVSFGGASFTGLKNSSPLDGSGSTNTGTFPTACSTGAFSTSNPNDLLLIASASGDNPLTSYAEPSGFTSLSQQLNAQDFDFAYKIVSLTQSGINPTWGTNMTSWAGLGLAYKGLLLAKQNRGMQSGGNLGGGGVRTGGRL